MLSRLSMVALALMVIALVTLVFRDELFAHGAAGIAVQCAAAGLMLWARLAFGGRSFHANADPTPGGLVRRGPYAVIRHPIYTAACAFGLVGIATHWSLVTALLGVLLLAGGLGRMLCEERLVAEMYPEYRDYMRATSRMVPFVF